MSWFAPAPEPKTPLGRMRLLAPRAAVKVSPLCLGAMNFGTAWEGFLGKCDKETSMQMLDTFYESGGNFIDTANNYQDEQSETWVGEWMKKRGNRDEIVLATKYTTGFRSYQGFDNKIPANYAGNGSKSLHLSVKYSLEKLQTDYIDLLYVHWWDFSTTIEEVMLALNNLVRSGKVLYLGASDTPAWIVSKANQYARDHGLTPFSVYQGRYNASFRDLERDIIPMCRDEGMGIAPWGVLGGGAFKTEEQSNSGEGRKGARTTESNQKVFEVLSEVGKTKDVGPISIAMAWAMHKYPYLYPIIGGRKVEHLKANIDALKIVLSDEEMKKIEDAAPFDYGFPNSVFAGNKEIKSANDIFLIPATGVFDFVEPVKKVTIR